MESEHAPDRSAQFQAQYNVHKGEGMTSVDVTTIDKFNEEEEDDGERYNWDNKLDFLLSVIGYAVDLANIWRFPYLCYKNGGGVFLIPYAIMLFIGGIPLFYMELCLGQFTRQGSITAWKICPILKGVGYSACLISFFVGCYYPVIISWGLYYFVASFWSPLPWKNCDHSWNTNSCTSDYIHAINQSNQASTPAAEFFNRKLLGIHESSGIDDPSGFKWDCLACTTAIFVFLYLAVMKGVKMSGKVVWVTASVPYIILFILLIRGIMLPGSLDGIKYYLSPNLEKLFHPQVWIDACVQIFFSLGAGFGVLIAFSSYNQFHNNCYTDALYTSVANCLTSFFSGFVIFTVLGYMAEKQGVAIEHVATEGPGLVFVVYPEAISTFPWPNAWSIIFFIMLLMLGLDSAMGGLEAVITGITDVFPKQLKQHREAVSFVVIAISFFFALSTATKGGGYIVTLLDNFTAGTSILVTVLFEAIAVFWIYGVNQFSQDINQMMYFTPGIILRIVWKFLAPLLLTTVVAVSFFAYEPLTYEGYVYPFWAQALGWIITFTSMGCIPVMMIVTVLQAPGNDLGTKLAYSITPVSEHHQVAKGEIKRFKLSHWLSI